MHEGQRESMAWTAQVLLLTDDRRFGHLLRAFLELKGYRVDVVCGAAGPEVRGPASQADVLVLDGTGGPAKALAAARSLLGAAPGVPLVILAEPAVSARLQRAVPAAEIVVRPDDPVAVIAAVARQLARGRSAAPATASRREAVGAWRR